ncbi:alpha/beta hydrolase [Mangrovimonas sp. DI 80]|nr:alpha/beta hydrolase [Mangrovimonas sp. DI 80]
MKSIFFLLTCFVCVNHSLMAQDANFTTENISVNEIIDGTLLIPNGIQKPPLAILIAGSGPTDRNGNQNFAKNNSLKKLAEALTREGIATFRYDKRSVKLLQTGKLDEEIMFDDFVTDASDVLQYFKKKKAFSKIYIIGHSQGSLIGMLAAKDNANGFISLAGPGKGIDEVLKEQIAKSAPQFSEESNRVIDILKSGQTTTEYSPALNSIFNIDIQPFMINWMRYDPQASIAMLDMPILILNGTNDLQISEADAELLKSAAPNAQLKIIDKMNHVFIEVDDNELENFKTYNDASLPISQDLVESISAFIKSN